MPRGDEQRPEMTAAEFRLLRDLIYAECGILLREDLKFVTERRLWPRLELLGLSDFASYHRYLRFDPGRRAELEAAIEAIATNETYFFREQPQLKAFSEELVPRLVARNQRLRKLRIWSAGCSTGEEPYTIAMLLRECGLVDGWDVQIFGSDISRRVLTTARKGEYGPSSMRATEPELLQRYFEPAGARWRIREDIRAMVTFGQLNLLSQEVLALVPRMDVIFCRNVLIYFDVPARKRVLASLYDRLWEGGYLLLGHSESLIQLTADFELVHLQNDLVYRRPEPPGRAAPVDPRRPATPAAGPASATKKPEGR